MSDDKSGKPLPESHPDQSAKPATGRAEDDQQKPRKTLPMVSIPDDDQLMAEEMADLFDEDRVSHQHGSSEPEAD
ncbi:hypothetical protein YTPLAS18_07890 [Nitrospira sp.]|nr:hypothetical protein YTPLAS18_07890 [Nitrospira sp.]